MTDRSLRLGPLLRLAFSGGRSDYLRIILTAAGSALGTVIFLLALSVLFIGADNGPYQLPVLEQDGLHPGVLITLVLVNLPVLVFVGLCTRVGAPARNRRLAMIRMAGGTPSEVTRITAAETGFAAVLGSAIGTLGFYLWRTLHTTARTVEVDTLREETLIENGEKLTVMIPSTTEQPGYFLPTDVDIPLWAVFALVSLLPALVTASSVVALRKVRISPFGVTRLQTTRPPALTPALLFLTGSFGLLAWHQVMKALSRFRLPGEIDLVIGLGLLLLALSGLLFGTASFTALLGRTLAPRTGRPWLLLASRRMMTSPYTASRATTSVVLTAFIGGITTSIRSYFLAQDKLDERSGQEVNPFYVDTLDMIRWAILGTVLLASASLLVTSSEAIVQRRRTLAALSAAGTPRRTLALSTMAETLLPLVPVVAVSSTCGMLIAQTIYGQPSSSEGVASPPPWGDIALLNVATLGVCGAVTALSLTFLPQSTNLNELRTAA